jgi:hypothetical protein
MYNIDVVPAYAAWSTDQSPARPSARAAAQPTNAQWFPGDRGRFYTVTASCVEEDYSSTGEGLRASVSSFQP